MGIRRDLPALGCAAAFAVEDEFIDFGIGHAERIRKHGARAPVFGSYEYTTDVENDGSDAWFFRGRVQNGLSWAGSVSS